MNANTSLTTQVNTNVALGDMERMAIAITKSGLFGMKTPEQALALMIVAQAENKHPGTVAAEYHIIQGRAALKSDAMLARFQSSGGRVEWHDHTNEVVSATFTHPQGGALRIDWDVARAKAAGLGGKDNWRNYPRQMLRARVISEGVRAVFPGVLQGMYTPEEVGDFSTPTRQTVTLADVVAAVPAVQDTVVETLPPVAKKTSKKSPAVVEVTPEVAPEPIWQDALEPLLAGNEEAVNRFLAAKGQIAYGGTWREVKDAAYRDRMLGNTERFLGAVKAFVGEDAK